MRPLLWAVVFLVVACISCGARVIAETTGPTVTPPAGSCVPTPERPCPHYCNILVFDGPAGALSGRCTIVTQSCTPAGNSPPSCGDANLRQQAGDALRSGAPVYIGQGGQGSMAVYTQLNATEMNAILGSFLQTGNDPGPQSTPPSGPSSGQIEPPTSPPPPSAPPPNLGPQGIIQPPSSTDPPPAAGSGYSFVYNASDGSWNLVYSEARPDDTPPADDSRSLSERVRDWVTSVAERVDFAADPPPEERRFGSIMSGPLDVSSGENWGDNLTSDSGRPLDAQTWEEWERRLGQQILSDEMTLGLVDAQRLHTLESDLEGLRNGYRPDSVVYQALDSALGCVRSGECATYTDAMLRITNGLGFSGALAHDFADRYTDYLGNREMLRNYVLPADLTTQDENRQMDRYINIMSQPPEVLDAMGIRPGMTFGEVDERLRDISHEMRMYEYDMLERAEREKEEVIDPFFETERQRRLDEAAERALEEYNRVTREEGAALSERLRLEEMGRLLNDGWVRANEIVDQALTASAEATAEARDLAARMWEAQFSGEANLSGELERLQPLSSVRTVFNPDGSFRQEITVTGPNGEQNVFGRGGDGYYRTDDPREVYRNFIYEQELERAIAGTRAEAEGINLLNERLAFEAELAARFARDRQLSEPITFAYDSSAVPGNERTQTFLGTAGGIMAGTNDRYLIEGHTDTFGNDRYNDALSARRADAVAADLVSRYPALGGRLQTVGYGEQFPLATAEDSRRVIICPIQYATRDSFGRLRCPQ